MLSYIKELINQSYESGYAPRELHVMIHFICLIQTVICMIYCAKTGRWNTAPPSTPSPLAIVLMKCMLCQLFILFGFEIFIIKNLKAVALFDTLLHHIFAMAIFVLTILEPNAISFSYCIPFFFHNIYWTLNAKNDYLLFIYNVSLVYAAVRGFLSYNARIWIPLVCVILFNCNLVIYFHGDYSLTIIDMYTTKGLNALAYATLTSIPVYVFVLWFHFKKKKNFHKSFHSLNKINI